MFAEHNIYLGEVNTVNDALLVNSYTLEKAIMPAQAGKVFHGKLHSIQ